MPRNPFSEADLARVLRAAGAPRDVAASRGAVLYPYFVQYEITSPLRIGHFVAQIAHESDRFRTTKEYWGPTAAQRGYEGRRDLGNNLPGDGSLFRGRGLIQLTGRYNYTAFKNWLHRNGFTSYNPVANPASVAEMPLAVLASIWYWTEAEKPNGRRTDLRLKSDLGDTTALVREITRLVNGGYNGIAHRLQVFRDVMPILRDLPAYNGDKVPLALPGDSVNVEPTLTEPKPVEDVDGGAPDTPTDDTLVVPSHNPPQPSTPSEKPVSAWSAFVAWLKRLVS